MLISLPNDVISKGYKKTGQFSHEQVFYSPSLGFEGTEKEFLKNGYAYEYVQADKFKRIVKG